MMRPFQMQELEGALEAARRGADVLITGVTSDSRHIQPGDLFVALRGERYDGHHYLAAAANAGAAGALVEEGQGVDLPCLVVEDTLRALGRLGAFNRDLYSGPVVAITGSSGKTTAKNMIHSVLSQAGNTMATEGNFNNEIGVPLTLLRLDPSVQFAVIEMGAGKAGDIAWLCELGKPGISLLLNAMPAHLDGFGSVDQVAQAKGEIFDGLEAGDVAVINSDQSYAGQWRKRSGAATVIDFGLENAAAISATAINVRGVEGSSFTASTPEGDIAIRLSLPGRHNVANALAAIAVGLACNLDLTTIRDGLEALRPTQGRLHPVTVASGACIIDDCYNANPGSVRAAIDLLGSCQGNRVLVLGAMRELGPDSEAMHREIGAHAQTVGIDRLWGVGEELRATVAAFGGGGEWFVDREAAAERACAEFGRGDTVLVKGSRSAGMELVLQALLGPSAAGEA
ncbi:MAG: UDP-N-acetylmuramoyl-tripeptide--D-alanyl-D-alanine ligase [Pseudomonadota bacterium]